MNPRIPLFLCAALAFAPLQTALAQDVGQEAPQCSLASLDGGQRYDLRQFRGKVLYVDFWASWCTPCIQSFPFLNQLDGELRDKGLQVVAINLDERRADAQGFLDERPARFNVAVDDSKACPQAFGVKAMPSSYLVDRKGVIRHVHWGFRPHEAEQVRGLVEQLLAEAPASQ